MASKTSKERFKERLIDQDSNHLVFPQCNDCKHNNRDGTCKAFPDGIPKDILTGKILHNKPFAGQKGKYIYEKE